MSFFRRRPLRQAVSFFAFQDIITALAGALLIIVLALAWQKSHRPKSAANAAVSGPGRAEYEQLQVQIKLLESELSARTAALKAQRQEFAQNNGASSRSKQLAEELQKLEKVIRQRKILREDLRRETTLLQKLQANSTEQEKQYQRLAAAAGELQKSLQDRQLRKKLAALPRRSAILDCSRTRWLWSDAPGQWQLLGSAPGSIPALDAAAELEKRLSTPPRLDCLIIAVRPSAGAFAGALKEQLRWKFPRINIISEPLLSENSGGLEL